MTGGITPADDGHPDNLFPAEHRVEMVPVLAG